MGEAGRQREHEEVNMATCMCLSFLYVIGVIVIAEILEFSLRSFLLGGGCWNSRVPISHACFLNSQISLICWDLAGCLTLRGSELQSSNPTWINAVR